ncbi:MAG: hypothetical protein II695_11005 [Oscillospiraceae bacterium]|nr:hypothetical protein [Oscillospiraceae bacterium]
MTDKNYSIDDILGEFKGSSGDPDQLDDILRSYPATSSYDDDLADIFDNGDSALSVSGFNISQPGSYPSAEEIRRKAANITLVPDEELSPEDRAKKQQQINYEIMSGDYERKNVPQELKTSIELEAERLDREENPESADAPEEFPDIPEKADKPFFSIKRPKGEKESIFPWKRKKKDKAQKGFGLDLLGDVEGVHDEDDDFEKKYGSIPLFTEEEREELIQQSMNDDMHTLPADLKFEDDQGHSLSEKMEMEEYSEKYSSDDDIPEELPRPVGKEPEVKRVDNPLDKYQDLDKVSELDLESIIEQYDPPKKITVDTSPLKPLTDMVNKLIAKEDDGVSELGSRKIKKEVRPIERPQASDVDFGLSGKILSDTFSFKTANPEIQRLEKLRQSREEKVRSFDYKGLDSDDDAADEKEEPIAIEEDNEPETIDDFESLMDAPAIAQHIEKQKSELIIRLLVLVICFAVSVYIAVANDLTLPVLKTLTMIDKRLRPDSFLTINTAVGVIAGIVCLNNMMSGLSQLFSLKPNNDSLCAVTLVSSLLTSLLSLLSTNVIRGNFAFVYMPVALGALIFNTVGKLLIVFRTQRGFANISGDTEHYALFCMKEDSEQAVNFTRGALTDLPRLAGMHKTEMVTNFLKNSYTTDSTDGFCRKQVPLIGIFSVVIGIVAGFMSREESGSMGAFCVGLSVFSAVWAVCSCYAMMLIVNLPMNRLSESCAKKQGAVIGFDSIEEFSGVNSVMVDAAQLFPAGSIKLMNIKSFFNTSMDEAIVQAASLTHQSGSILDSMFYEIICGKTQMLSPVESYLYEDSMGLCGWINNKRVLLGNRDLMINHSIEGLPSAVKEQEYTKDGRIAVYLSISGQLSAMFIIELVPSYPIVQALRDLERKNIQVMLRSVDSMLAVNTLSDLFDVSPSFFRLVPFRYHSDFSEAVGFTAQADAKLACTGSFPSFVQMILGTKTLHTVTSVGIATQAAQILFGILLVLFLVLIRNFRELTVTMVLLYNLAFAAGYAIFQRFYKM